MVGLNVNWPKMNIDYAYQLYIFRFIIETSKCMLAMTCLCEDAFLQALLLLKEQNINKIKIIY